MARGIRHGRVVGGLVAALVGSVVLVLLTVEDISSFEERDLAVPFGSHEVAMLQLQASRAHMDALHSEGLSGAISALKGEDTTSKARLSSLAHAGW